jgi:hypothetical protein
MQNSNKKQWLDGPYLNRINYNPSYYNGLATKEPNIGHGEITKAFHFKNKKREKKINHFYSRFLRLHEDFVLDNPKCKVLIMNLDGCLAFIIKNTEGDIILINHFTRADIDLFIKQGINPVYEEKIRKNRYRLDYVIDKLEDGFVFDIIGPCAFYYVAEYFNLLVGDKL